MVDLTNILDDPAFAQAEQELAAQAASKQTKAPRKSSPRGSRTRSPRPATSSTTVATPVAAGSTTTPASTATPPRRAVMADYRAIASEIRAAKAEEKEETKDLSVVASDILHQLGKLDSKALAKVVEKAGFDASDDESEDKKGKKSKKDKATDEDKYFDGAPVPDRDGFVFQLMKGKDTNSSDRSDYRIVRKSDWDAEKDKPAKSAGFRGMLFGNPAGGN